VQADFPRQLFDNLPDEGRRHPPKSGGINGFDGRDLGRADHRRYRKTGGSQNRLAASTATLLAMSTGMA